MTDDSLDGVGTEGYSERVPNQPKTPVRHIRIDDALWAAARRATAQDQTTVADVVRAALRDYLAKRPKKRA